MATTDTKLAPHWAPTAGMLLLKIGKAAERRFEKALKPSGLTPRVAKVLVTVGRHTHGKCSYLRADGTFGKAIRCKATPYVVAHVNAAKAKVGWSYSIGTALPASRYFEHLDHWQKPMIHRDLIRRTQNILRIVETSGGKG